VCDAFDGGGDLGGDLGGGDLGGSADFGGDLASGDGVDLNGDSVTSDISLDTVPANRPDVIDGAFDSASENIKDIVSGYSDNLTVENAEGDDCCHYNPNDATIRMRDDMDDAEYAEVFTHEYGHFVDDQMGWPSESHEFVSAVATDRDLYDRQTEEGKQRFDNMLNDTFSSGAAYDRMVSDNLSALFQNDPEIKERFDNEGVPCYQHSNDYWDSGHNRENEIFANNFSIQANGDSASMAFLDNYMPNTTTSFNSLISQDGRG